MKCTIFTHYFSPDLTRKFGRRISMEKAKNFSTEKLERILREMNISFDSRDAAYPRVPWMRGRMYILDSGVKKTTLLKIIERRL